LAEGSHNSDFNQNQKFLSQALNEMCMCMIDKSAISIHSNPLWVKPSSFHVENNGNQRIGNTCEAQLCKIRNRKIVSFTEINKEMKNEMKNSCSLNFLCCVNVEVRADGFFLLAAGSQNSDFNQKNHIFLSQALVMEICMCMIDKSAILIKNM
jgi:hypothetical protein